MIFKDFAPKYFEAGLPVIPLSGKLPKIRKWEEWSNRAQTEDELEWLLQRFPTANVGAPVGLKFCVLDIDTDDERIIQAIPYTPIRRRGRSGRAGCYFYKACNLPNRPGTKYPIDFLNHGRQVVLPPSIHPDTKESYSWVGEEDILTFNFSELPTITLAQIEQIEKLCEKFKIYSEAKEMRKSGEVEVCLTDVGRNNRLTSVAYAMACDNVPEEEAVARLLQIDKDEHETPWFEDSTEPHRGKDPKKIACRMYERAVNASIKRGDRVQVIIENYPSFVLEDKPKIRIPAPRGLIKQFQEYCNLTSMGNQDVLGLGGGLALMAAICSNRFRTKVGSYDVWPNLYVINLAHSGFGKETPQRALDEVLMHSGLLGSATYKSGSSIVMGLPEQPHRLDVIDECAMLLKAMAAREDYKADIVDVLSSLYSKSSTYFHGYTSKGDGKNFGACWNPCVNILGSTTPQGFKGSVNKDMAAKGLLPRFLVFWQEDYGEYKIPQPAEDLLKEIKRRVRQILSVDQREHPDSRQKDLLNPKAEEMIRFDPEIIPMSDGAQRMIQEIQKEYFYDGKKDPDGFESAFKNRFAQHVSKIALLDTISLGLDEIGTDSVRWAHELVKWQWETVKELYEYASAENEHEKMNIRFLNFIKKRGTVTQSELTTVFRMMPTWQRKDILNSLIESNKIRKVMLPSNGGRKPIAYCASVIP
jgi:hypothetical protein